MSESLVAVRLIGLPIDLYDRTSQHQQSLQREFDLLRSAQPESDAIPNTLLAVIDELDQQFGRFASPSYAELDAAVAAGVAAIDVTYDLPPEAAAAAQRLDDLLDEADEYCRAGTQLLTLAIGPDERQFRKWFLSEFIRQIAGQEPTSWSEHSRHTRPPTSSAATAADDVSVTASPLPDGWSLTSDDDVTTLVVAGDLDLATAPALRSALTRARERSSTVMVDTRLVEFMDSVAISVVVAARNRLVDDGGGLRMRTSAATLRSLQLVGLDRALEATP